jgi:hypothetical protein
VGGPTGAVCIALDATPRSKVLLAASHILRGFGRYRAKQPRSTDNLCVTHSGPALTGRDPKDRTSCGSCALDDSFSGVRARSLRAPTSPRLVRDRRLRT